jgi:hypothetical protein
LAHSSWAQAAMRHSCSYFRISILSAASSPCPHATSVTFTQAHVLVVVLQQRDLVREQSASAENRVDGKYSRNGRGKQGEAEQTFSLRQAADGT